MKLEVNDENAAAKENAMEDLHNTESLNVDIVTGRVSLIEGEPEGSEQLVLMEQEIIEEI